MRYLLPLFLILYAGVLFSQTPSNPMSVFEEAKALSGKNPVRAFDLYETAIKLSWQNHQDEIVLNSFIELSKLIPRVPVKKADGIFGWYKIASRHFDKESNLQTAQLFYTTANFYSTLTPHGDSAIYYFNKALKIRLAQPNVEPERVAECYHGLGDVYKYTLFDFNEAEKNYEKALRIRERSTVDKMTMAINYYNLAVTNRSQRDFERALPYAFSVVQLCQEMKNYEFLEQTYTMVGNIYRDMNLSAQAQEYYQKAISLNVNTKSLRSLTWSYLGMGETLKNDGRWNEAIQNFKTALQLFEAIDRKNDLSDNFKRLWLHCQLQLTETYRLGGFYPESRNMLRLYFNHLHKLNMDRGHELVEYYDEMGNYFQATKKYDSALVYYQKSMVTALPAFKPATLDENPIEKMIGDNYYINGTLRYKARVFREKYRSTHQRIYLTQEAACLELAERLLLAQADDLDAEESRSNFQDENYNVYEELLQNLLMRYADDHSAALQSLVFTYFEKSKARTLSEAMLTVDNTTGINSTDTLVRRLNEIRRSWLSAEHKLAMELQRKDKNDSLTNALRHQQLVMDREIQKIRGSIEEKFPGYSKVRFNEEVASLTSVQSYLQKNDHAILEFFFGFESVYGLAIQKDKIIFERIASVDSLRMLTEAFLQHFSQDHSSIDQQVFVNFVNSSSQLYDKLIRPFHDVIEGATFVQVIPDGIISQIPFELLLSEKPTYKHINYKDLKYALHQVPFGYAYSATLLLNAVKPGVSNPSVLAMGFTGGHRLRAPEEALVEIEGAELELEALQKQFKKGTFIVGPEVTESNFKSLAPSFDIIHLAIHGKGNIYDRFSSSLFFRTAMDTLDDGKLHAYELYGLKFNARLAVLTACESGLGKAHKGEGMMSIATAFTYSGCQSTILSLWKVNDLASVDLMNDFYQQIRDGNSIDQALLQAKLNYLERADELTADPVIWAPMVAYGNNGPVIKKQSSIIGWLLISIPVMILLVFLIRKKMSR